MNALHHNLSGKSVVATLGIAPDRFFGNGVAGRRGRFISATPSL